MRKNIIFGLGITLLLMTNVLRAQQYHADNGDGTFSNPVIAADYPDPDVIRVDSVYYFVSTTMFVFPGVTILKSYDLVNWEYCSNAAPRFDYGSCYNLEGCNRYGHGQWATSLKYKDGTFFLYHVTLDEGGFLYTAQKAEGPWTIRKIDSYYDPGLFFDDDGRIYIAHGYGKIFMTELNLDFFKKTKDSLIIVGDIRGGLEGTHIYKKDGFYYLYCTYGGADGFQVAFRSKSLYGPFEQKVVIRDTIGDNFGVHQGSLIQTQTGEWWTLLFTDEGPFGRFPCLQPVTWTDGWPMVGVNGQAPMVLKKPNVGKIYPAKTLPTSDEFDATTLGMQWGWNHNPVPERWSLTAKSGNLRLITSRVVSNLREAPNTLTQRMFEYYSKKIPTCGSTKLDIANMKDGDIAGLALFQEPYAYVGVKKSGGKQFVIMVNNGTVVDSAEISGSSVYFAANAHYGTGKATFEYSTDNKMFKPIGNELVMRFNLKIFTGNKFCLFNYATKETGGFVDFDWFRMEPGK